MPQKTFKNTLQILLQNYKKVLGRLCLLSLLLFSYSSCTDQGCIEADDFGEYEQQIVTVKANALAESCDYYPDKPLSDAEQGSGIKECLTSQNLSFTDEVDSTYATKAVNGSHKGCLSFEGTLNTDYTFTAGAGATGATTNVATAKFLCTSLCKEKCENGNGADTGSAEPSWVSTTAKVSGQNSGVTISPGDKVFIRALGKVTLSKSAPLTAYTSSINDGLQSSKSYDFNKSSFIDIKADNSKIVNFSGRWYDNSNNYVGADVSHNLPETINNGARRLVAYALPHPTGYAFNVNATDEKVGTLGTPLFVDENLWQCDYSITPFSCTSLAYNISNGYTQIAIDGNPANLKTASGYSYQIDASAKAANLGAIGGMIRWNGDNVAVIANQNANLANAQSLTTQFKDNIATLAGYAPKLWLETTLNTAVTKSPSNTISSWNDASGNNHNFTQAVDLKKPLYKSDGINGLPSVNFNEDQAQDQNLEAASSFASNNFTVFVVAKNKAGQTDPISCPNNEESDVKVCPDADGQKFLFHPSYKSSDDAGAGISMGINRIAVYEHSTVYLPSITIYAPVNNETIGSKANIISWQFNDANNSKKHTIYFNGVLAKTGLSSKKTNVFAPENIGGSAYTGIGTGHYGSWSGDVGEVIIFDSVLTDLQRQKVEQYLEEKWNYSDQSHDIVMQKSGFVSFTTIIPSSTTSPNCIINAAIINPSGSKTYSGSNNFDNDYYEYPIGAGNPLDSLSIPYSTNSSKSWSEKVFVRKGQIIRFSPRSWNNTWTSNNISQECGVGMAMRIEERPAFLCKGTQTEDVKNPSCIPKTDADGVQSCKDYSEACINPALNNGGKFCPDENCQDSYTASCYKASQSANGVTYPEINQTSCLACKTSRNNAGAQSTTSSVPVDQCYDLENYQGKVSNIPNNGFTDLDLADQTKSKNAKKLTNFDGYYGNFSSFRDLETYDTDNNHNKIYQLSAPLVPSQDSRIKFLLIDNSNFLINSVQNKINSYTDNNVSGVNYNGNYIGYSNTTYNGLNGYKIDLTGTSEYKNGQWLEAILCAETDSKTAICSNYNLPIQVANQPNVVAIGDPTSQTQDPLINGYYHFDEFGNLVRFAGSGSLGVNPDSKALSTTQIGDNFYKHYYGDETEDKVNTSKVPNLRLSFKIKDTDIGNCNIANPANNISPPAGSSCNGGCDGIITENPFYDDSDYTNNGKVCQASNNAAPRIGLEQNDCKNQYFCANKYHNNSGKYDVLVRVENKKNNLSQIVNQVITPVIEVMDGTPDGKKIGQAERIYKGIIGDSRFQAILQIMLVAMITFYGLGYLMGVSEFSQSEILSRLIKIGVIYLFISPSGWYWFNQLFVNGFKHGTDYITFLMASAFDRSNELQTAISSNNFTDKSILFSGIDKVFGLFFSSAVQKKVSALLFASIFGWAYLYIIYLSFFLYIYAVANAVLLYLTAQVFISILFVMAPLFFLMLLFNQTKDMFDKWLSELISFSLQQIFLLTTLSFFNMMMYEVIKMSLGYRICWDDVWVINIYIRKIKLLSFWTIASMPPRTNAQSEVGNIGSPEGIPSIFSILFIWIIASLMHKFISFITDIAASLGGGVKASDMASGIKSVGEAMHKQVGDMYQDKIGKHVDSGMQSVDRALFNSGAKADADRKKSKEQDKSDSTNRNTLAKSGSDAVAQFKKSNAIDLVGKSAEEQKQLLTEVRNNAMKSKAAAMGLSEKDSKRLIESKSSITNARNVSGLAKEVWQKRGSLGSSLADKEVSTTFSGREISAAIKNTEKQEDRDKLVEASKTGALDVKVTNADKSAENFSKSFEQAKNLELSSAVKSFTKGMGQSLQHGTVDQASMAISSVGKGASGVNVTSESSQTQARKQLESEGAIDKQAFGTAWAASDADKKQIAQRAAEIRKSKTSDIVQNDARTADFVAKLNKPEAVIKAQENLAEVRKNNNPFSKEGKKARSDAFKQLQNARSNSVSNERKESKENLQQTRKDNSMLGLSNNAKLNISSPKAHSERREARKSDQDVKGFTKERNESLKEKLEAENGNNDSNGKEKTGLYKSREDADNKYRSISSEANSLASVKKEKNLENDLKKAKPAEKSAIQAQLKELRGTSEYKAESVRYKELSSEANKYKNISTNIGNKIAANDNRLKTVNDTQNSGNKNSQDGNVVLKGVFNAFKSNSNPDASKQNDADQDSTKGNNTNDS